ncbi:MAG: glycerophosphodiester phosphodiesterase family protein [Pyrinomonadaceae bacterium]
MNRRAPLIIAHRGASAYAPENTLAAFQMAVDAGADGVEFDVQLAKDGVPVVIHDTGLRRTARREEMVADLTSTQLGKVDVGSWFNLAHPNLARAEFAAQQVPTLARVLTLLGSSSSSIYIELKCDESTYKPLAAAVCDVIRDSPLLPRLIVKSFKLAAIPEVRCLLPTVQTAALFEPSIATILRRRRYIIAMAREFGAHRLSLHYSLATRKLTALAAEAGMPVTIWTADNVKWIRRCKKQDIEALITNDPAKLLAARN